MVSFSCAICAETERYQVQPPDLNKYVTSAPRPEYPLEARLHHFAGIGLTALKIDTRTGAVISATMSITTGHKILDDAVLKAYRAWRFKPGTISDASIPTTFTMTGVPFEKLNGVNDAINAPRPEYPYEARVKHLKGSGVVLLEVDARTGFVTSARMSKSTGHEILDESALKAFRRWHFKKGIVSPVRVPIRFTMEGAEY